MTALVTGATGYIGSNLCRRLVRDGWRVHAAVRPASDTALVADVRDRMAFHVHDGTAAGMSDIVAQARPDVVFHLASLFVAQHRPEQVDGLVASNMLFGAQLLEAMEGAGVKILVNTGTSWQHYEDAQYDPVCLYAATKQAFGDVVEFYVRARGLRCVTLTIFDSYGPADPRPKLFTLLRNAAGGGAPLAMSPGMQRLDLVFIDDIVEAYCTAAARLIDGQETGHGRYCVRSGDPKSLREIAALYSSVTGRPLSIDWGGRPYRDREVMEPYGGGVTLPGWKPLVGLEEGIRRMEGLR